MGLDDESGRTGPPSSMDAASVDDENVAVRLAVHSTADARVEQPLEQTRLARADDDQIRVPALCELEDHLGGVTEGDGVLGLECPAPRGRRRRA